MQRYAPGGPYLIAGALLFGLGCLSVVADSAWWYLLQQGYSLGEHGSVMAQVESDYLTEAIAIGVAV